MTELTNAVPFLFITCIISGLSREGDLGEKVANFWSISPLWNIKAKTKSHGKIWLQEKHSYTIDKMLHSAGQNQYTIKECASPVNYSDSSAP